jgi:hypothetical protein
MRVPARAGVAAAVAAVTLATAGCSSSGSGTPAEDPQASSSTDPDAAGSAGGQAAADTTVCSADATALPTPIGSGFPDSWPFPPQTVVYHVEDRGDFGTIATAVSASSFTDVLQFMNGDVVDAGFTVESGETEEHDAEAEWTGNGYRGRWAIRESAQCPGETVIQVVAADGS